MSRIAIIGASAEALHTIEYAHRLGHEVIAIDGNPAAEGLARADIPVVTDISDESATIDVLKKLGCDWIQTVPIGRYLTTIGACNDYFGLKGISRDAATLCTDKFAFHRILNAAGLRDCVMISVSNGKYNLAAGESDNLPYPMILKPRYGSGSRGIFIVNNVGELNEAVRMTCDEDYVLEECVEGEEYGVDGAVIDGCFHMVLLRQKTNTPLPMRQAVAYMSVPTDDAFYEKVNVYMDNVVKTMGLNNCLLHADILRTVDGPFAIEVSGRPSGHNLHNLFTPLCTGVDVAEQFMRFQAGEDYSFRPDMTKSMMIHYFDYEGEVKKVPAEADVRDLIDDRLICWNCSIDVGDVLPPPSTGHSLMGRGYYIIENPTASDALDIEKLFDIVKRENI